MLAQKKNKEMVKREKPASQRGRNEVLFIRISPELLKRLDSWRRQQDDPPTRPDAVRQLIEQVCK